jgi:hypothetical protein
VCAGNYYQSRVMLHIICSISDSTSGGEVCSEDWSICWPLHCRCAGANSGTAWGGLPQLCDARHQWLCERNVRTPALCAPARSAHACTVRTRAQCARLQPSYTLCACARCYPAKLLPAQLTPCRILVCMSSY